jgi:hypothetical protein
LHFKDSSIGEKKYLVDRARLRRERGIPALRPREPPGRVSIGRRGVNEALLEWNSHGICFHQPSE